MSVKHQTLIKVISLALGSFVIFYILPAMELGRGAFARFDEIICVLTGEEKERILGALSNTFFRFAVAGTIGGIVGVVLGSSRAMIQIWRNISEPWIDLARIIPAIVWIPVLYLLDGVTSNLIPILLGALYSSVYLSLGVENELRSVSQDELSYASSQRHSIVERFKYCYSSRLKAGLTSGARLALSVALILVIVGEALTGVDGLGSLLTQYQTSEAKAELWTTILVIGFLALTVFILFEKLAKIEGIDK